MSNVNELVIQLRADTKQAIDNLQSFSNRLNEFSNNAVKTNSQLFQSAASQMEEFSKKAASLKNGMNGIANNIQVTMLGMAGSIGLFLKTSGDFEQWQIAFNVMLGSVKEGKKMMDSLVSFAARTPFDTREVVELSKLLMGVGFSAKEIIPTMKMLGDISAIVGRDKLPFIVKAFADVKTAGKLAGQEMIQFKNASVPLLQYLAEALGKTVTEVDKLSKNGQISFEAVRRAMELMTSGSGRMANAMEEQSKGLNVIFSNLKDNIGQNMRKIGDSIAPVFKDIGERLIVFTQKLKDIDPAKLEALAKMFLLLATGIASLFVLSKVTALFAGFAEAIAKLSLLLPVAALNIGKLVGAFQAGGIAGGIAAILNPWVLGLAAVGVGLYALYKHFENAAEAKKRFSESMNSYEPFFGKEKKDVEDLTNLIDLALIPGASEAQLRIMELNQKIATLKSTNKSYFEHVIEEFKKIGQQILSPLESAFGKIKEFYERFFPRKEKSATKSPELQRLEDELARTTNYINDLKKQYSDLLNSRVESARTGALLVAQSEEDVIKTAKRTVSALSKEFGQEMTRRKQGRELDLQEEIDWWEQKKAKYAGNARVLSEIDNKVAELRGKIREKEDAEEKSSLSIKMKGLYDYFDKNNKMSSQYYAEQAKRIAEVVSSEMNLSSKSLDVLQYAFGQKKDYLLDYAFSHEKSLDSIISKETGSKEKIAKIAQDIFENKADLADKSYDAYFDALEKILKAEGFTADQIEIIFRKILKIKESDLEKTVESYKKSLDEMFQIGIGFATDLQGSLSKLFSGMFTDKDSGLGKMMKDGLSNWFRGANEIGSLAGNFLGGAGSLLAGALGGLIGVGVTAIISGLFGSTKYKTVQEYAKEAFDRMVNETNAKLDEIGKQKTVYDKQLEFLKTLKEAPGASGESAISDKYLSILGVGKGTTIDEAIHQIQNKKIQYLDEQSSAILEDFKKKSKELSELQSVRSGSATVKDFFDIVSKYGAYKDDMRYHVNDSSGKDVVMSVQEIFQDFIKRSGIDITKMSVTQFEGMQSKFKSMYGMEYGQLIEYANLEGNQKGLQQYVNEQGNVNALSQLIDSVKTQTEIATTAQDAAKAAQEASDKAAKDAQDAAKADQKASEDSAQAAKDASAKAVEDAKKALLDQISLVQNLKSENGINEILGDTVGGNVGYSASTTYFSALDSMFNKLRGFYDTGTTGGLDSLTDIYGKRKSLYSDEIKTLSDSLASASTDSEKATIQSKIDSITQSMKKLPQFSVGAMDIPQTMMGILHPREAIFTQPIMDGVRAGKLTISGPGQSSESNVTYITNTINIDAKTKSGDQIYQEIKPFFGSTRKSDKGAYRGVFRG